MPRVSAEKAITKIDEYLQRLNELHSMSYREGESLREDMNISIRGFLPLAFDEGKEKVEEFDSYVNSYIIVAGQKESPTQEQKDFERRLKETKTFLTSWKDELNLTKESSLPIEKSDTSFQSNEVFIVHGHDDKATLELENLIRRLELKPVILHRQRDKGRTIIEKLEAESKGSNYAFILLTPDDDCMLLNKDTNRRSQIRRPRQNVVLELGFFMGNLGRESLCILQGGSRYSI